MDIPRELTELVEAHKSPPNGMKFYESVGSVLRDQNLLGYVSVIVRAWHEMDLDGVLCLDGCPVLYLKEYVQPCSSPERIALQRLFWNQGVANVLVLADPTSVHIYSGLAKPPDDPYAQTADEAVLIEKLSYANYIERIPSWYHDLATGHYYEENTRSFDPNQSVDSCLLDNLRALRNALHKGSEALDTKVAHAIIGRVLFLCYLLDRGVVSVERLDHAGQVNRRYTGTMLLAEKLEKQSHDFGIDYLYEMFGTLKEQFNGNMFDQDLDTERLLIQPSHFQMLTLFLGGHDVGSGQRTMGFWPYDFKMIPVETISAIYQDFLAAEDPEEQERKGAYYTPRFLAEMVVDVAVRNKPDAFDWSYFDPACGSGVFLVILFNRLANRWIQNQTDPVDYAAKAEALQRILRDQICGVDIQETACRIACFSLYLAYLDFFDPPDIRAYREKTGKPLPKLLDYGDGSDGPSADIPVIHRGDFLAGELLSDRRFDCIIGNPPWEGRQSKQLAQAFMQKAPLFLRNGGTGCLLLPSKILQNQTDAFQAEWLRQVTLERVIQLADYSFLLFQSALCPAFIALFTKAPPQPAQHLVEFVAPKLNRAGLRQGVIIVNPTARTWIPLSDILAATGSRTAPVVWKRRLWGTPRDQKLLDLLESLPPLSQLAGTPKEGKRWIKGEGLQPYYPSRTKSKPRTNPWSLEAPFLLADRDLQMFVFEPDCIALGERLQRIGASTEELRRVPHGALFKAPMVLISQGFSKVAFCDFDVLFQDSLQSISGPKEDTDLLMFLAAYLRSNLAKYYLFHTSANWGTERDKVHLFELLRIPFPLPGDEYVSPDAAQIVSQIAGRMKTLQLNLQETLSNSQQKLQGQTVFNRLRAEVDRKWRNERKKQIDAFQEELERLINRYFGLTDQEVTLVEDTIRVFAPSSTPTTRRSEKTVSLTPVEKSNVAPYATQGLSAYAATLTKTLNSWAEAEGSSYRVCAEGGTDELTGLAMVTARLSTVEAPYQMMLLSQRLTEALNEVHARALITGGTLFYQRDVIVFQGEKIHIIRPNILLNWTRTAALNDAARIYAEVALAGEER